MPKLSICSYKLLVLRQESRRRYTTLCRNLNNQLGEPLALCHSFNQSTHTLFVQGAAIVITEHIQEPFDLTLASQSLTSPLHSQHTYPERVDLHLANSLAMQWDTNDLWALSDVRTELDIAFRTLLM